MYPKKDSFLTLSSEIDLFINKYYKHELVRGIMLSFVFLVFLLSGAWFLESLFRFSSLGRGVLFFGASLFALIYISKLTLFPLIKLFGVHGRMSHEEASVLLSKKIPEIGDQLVNAIGLGKQVEKTETDLLRASIEQKALNSLKFDFRDSISIHDQRKMLFGFLVLFLISGACSFIYPDSIIPPLKRVVFFQKSFDKPIPFEFEVNNGRPLEVLENEPLEISIKTIGKTGPEQIFLYSKKMNFLD